MLPLRSVRVRLTLWYVLLLAVILAAFSIGVYLTLRHSLYDNLSNSLDNRANLLLSAVRYDANRPTLASSISPDDPSRGEYYVRVFDSSGKVTFEAKPSEGDVPVDQDAIAAALAGAERTRAATLAGDRIRVRTVPIERDGQVSGVLEVGQSVDDTLETLRTLAIILGIAYPVTLFVAGFGGVFLAGRALSPIDKLTRLARRMSAEDLSQRFDAQLPDDEVGRLARTFNEMIERLDDAFRRQRQFTADASHELRTPLTAVKGQVEVALSKSRNEEAYRQVLQAVNEEVDRMIRLTGSLLTLARADAGQIPISSDRVSVPDLVASALEQVRPLATQKGLTLRAASTEPAALQADEDLLLQLLLNLLDNAIKYTEPGGEVDVGWDETDEDVRLWVLDTGVGIESEHLPYVLDRFYRVDKARSRAEGGAGLGLAISRWIVEAHGGWISVESSVGKGSTFTAHLPKKRPQSKVTDS
jgi:heavy metal sensor kinase